MVATIWLQIKHLTSQSETIKALTDNNIKAFSLATTETLLKHSNEKAFYGLCVKLRMIGFSGNFGLGIL
jgi:hypothetical protein